MVMQTHYEHDGKQRFKKFKITGSIQQNQHSSLNNISHHNVAGYNNSWKITK